MPNNNMGSEKNVTEKTLKEAAEASGTSIEDARKNAHELLDKVLQVKEVPTDIRWKP